MAGLASRRRSRRELEAGSGPPPARACTLKGRRAVSGFSASPSSTSDEVGVWTPRGPWRRLAGPGHVAVRFDHTLALPRVRWPLLVIEVWTRNCEIRQLA